MKATQPKVEERAEQPYMGIRTEVPMSKLSKAIPQLTDEVFAWLGKQGVEPAGAPFIRYHVIDMAGKMDVEMGVPVASKLPGDDRVSAGVLPAGRYGALVYTGVKNGFKGNKALLDWGAAEGIKWDTYQSDKGDGFGARYESFLTDPADEPNMARWDTEVAIRLADAQSR